MTESRLPVVLLVFVITTAGLVCAEQRGSGATRTGGGPFDPSVVSLAQDFPGVSCPSTLAALKRLNLQKSEYETTAAYEQRLAALSDTATVGPHSLGAVLGFLVRLPVTTSYDADAGKLSIELPEAPNAFTFKGAEVESMESYRPVDTRGLTTSSYVGTNAFGAKTRVTKTSGRLCGIVYDYCGSAVPLEVPMSASDAKAFPRNPKVLFVGKLRQPYHRVYRDLKGPKIDDPYDREITVDGLIVEPVSIWFIALNGRVAAKVPVKVSCSAPLPDSAS